MKSKLSCFLLALQISTVSLAAPLADQKTEKKTEISAFTLSECIIVEVLSISQFASKEVTFEIIKTYFNDNRSYNLKVEVADSYFYRYGKEKEYFNKKVNSIAVSPRKVSLSNLPRNVPV